MKDAIIDLLHQYGSLSFEALRTFLRTDDETLSKEIAKLENIDIIKFGKNYELIDGKSLCSGTIFYKLEEPYITNDNGSYRIDFSENDLFTGDRYIYTLDENKTGRKVVNLVKFISHSYSYVVCRAGKVKEDGTRFFKVYDSNELVKKYKVRGTETKVTMGDLCFIQPTYLKDNGSFSGKYISTICKYNEDNQDILACIAASNVPYTFSDECLKELDSIPSVVSEEEKKNRLDLTNELIFTIDGDDAKDFDDAVSVKKNDDNTYTLGVHIADVSHYVKEDSAIDLDALERGTSIYLPDRVIPMLDFKLSNGICSLNEGVERLTISAIMKFDSNGEMLESEIKPSVIKSVHRMTYNKVNDIIDGDSSLILEYQDIYPSIMLMAELSKNIRRKRHDIGSIDFDIPETKIILGEDGVPKAIYYETRGIAEMMIEDFMLSANEAVATTLNSLEYPCLYRVHEEPSSEKIKEMAPFLKSMGVRLRASGSGITSKEVQKVLDKIKDEQCSMAVSNLILRAMAKARYDSQCLGHFGLALKYYCHFTSPIRRYPDLFVHRVLHNLIFDTFNFNNNLNHFESMASYLGPKTSTLERRAIDLEREVKDMKEAEYMEHYIGATFTGIISSVQSFGCFVTLDNGIEGLCHVSNMPDYVSYDKESQSLIGGISGVTYSVGDLVTIRVINASKETRRIDFIILGVKKGGRRK